MESVRKDGVEEIEIERDPLKAFIACDEEILSGPSEPPLSRNAHVMNKLDGCEQ